MKWIEKIDKTAGSITAQSKTQEEKTAENATNEADTTGHSEQAASFTPTQGSNPHSSDGIAEDLIRSMSHLCGLEMHIKTLIEKRVSEIDEGLVDTNDDSVVVKQMGIIGDLELELRDTTQLRRDDMRLLYKMYGEQGDKEQWCMVKHWACASLTAFEVYQAADGTPEEYELYDAYIAKNKMFIKSMSRFLGIEVTQCAACFADALKGGV